MIVHNTFKNSKFPVVCLSVGILIQLTNISKGIYHFYKVIQKQICYVHNLYTPCMSSLKPPQAALPIIVAYAGAITAETS
jgi:hypothetical protein